MKTTNENLFKLTLTALFTAIIFIMDFTPLGYITTGAFSITLMTLPVAIGSICLGVGGGMYLGALFGLTSFLMCFGVGFMIDPSAAIMFQTSPLATAFTCFIPRILAGFLTALIFNLLHKRFKNSIVSFLIPCGLMPLFNTVFFLSAYSVAFKNTLLAETTVKAVFLSAISLNGLIELVLTLLVGTVVSKSISSYIAKLKSR